jgi:hypothetical protein
LAVLLLREQEASNWWRRKSHLVEREGARVGASHLTSVAASILDRISEGDDVEGYIEKP